MLTFEQKMNIFDSYPQLQRRNVSLGRVNYAFEESLHDKKTVVYHLHPNGNGYVYAGLLSGYETDAKGMANIRDFSEQELRELVEKTLSALSVSLPEEPSAAAGKKKKKKADKETVWTDEAGHQLELRVEEGQWYLYAGLNLEMAFETLAEAEEYLAEEGFKQQEM